MSRIVIYPDAAGEWRWTLKASNGRVVASGEGYKTRSGATNGARAMVRAAKQAKVVVKA